jgi:4-aminobutyrate aminotransferase-like enzyme
MVAAEFDEKSVAKSAIASALERDVLFITCGFHDQVVRFIPALNIAEDDLRKGMRTFVEAARASQIASPA